MFSVAALLCWHGNYLGLRVCELAHAHFNLDKFDIMVYGNRKGLSKKHPVHFLEANSMIENHENEYHGKYLIAKIPV